MVQWDAWLGGLADVLGPLLSPVPPKVGSKRPGDLLDLSRLGWRLRGVDVRTAGDITRLFTSSIADLLDDHFECPQLQGCAGGQRRHRHLGRPTVARARRT